MIKFINNFVLVSMISLLFCSTALASGVTTEASRIGVAARPIGMGKAFVGLADDGSAIFMNPAGLGGFDSAKFTGMVGKIYEESTYYSVGIAAPALFGSLGIGYVSYLAPFIPPTLLTGIGTPPMASNYDNYNGGVLYISYGNRPLDVLSWGVTVKGFIQELKDSTGVAESALGAGWDIDLGLLVNPVPWAGIGVVAMNAMSFDSGGKFIWAPNVFLIDPLEEDIPMLYRAGVSLRILGEEGFTQTHDQELLLAVDTEMDPENPRPGLMYAGLEWMPLPYIALRYGVEQVYLPGAETEIQSNNTFGAGIVYSGITFDYACHQFGTDSMGRTHYFSLGYIGEKPQKEEVIVFEEPEPVTEEAEPFIPPEEPKPRPTLKSFYDVPEGYWAKDAIEALATLGILSGYPDGSFRPEGLVTRAELSTILVRARDVAIPQVFFAPFPDVPVSHWASRYVKAASDLNLIYGYPNGTFGPSRNLTRAEGVTVITRFAGVSPPVSIVSRAFPDLPIDHWASSSVWAAVDAGMLDYLIGKFFEPNKTLTRAEVAEIISRTPWGKAKIEELLGE